MQTRSQLRYGPFVAAIIAARVDPATPHQSGAASRVRHGVKREKNRKHRPIC